MVRKLCALSAVLGLATVASASPTLTYTATALSGGLTAYDVTVTDAADAGGSYGINGTFTATGGATITQTQAFGAIAVNDQAQATTFTNTTGSNYSSTTDSWLYDPFGANLNGTPSETSTTYTVNAGTGPGSNLQTSLFAHIVASGSVSFVADIGHLGIDTTYGTGSGQTFGAFVMNPGAPAPEPASIGVLALGGLALLARRRKA